MSQCVVILTPGFEEIEALAVVDILRRGGVTVTIAGITSEAVAGRNAIRVVPDTHLKDIDCMAYDMVVLPGGANGVENILNDRLAMDIVQRMNQESKYIAAICAAPKILAKLDIIRDKRVTSYPSERETVSAKSKEYCDDTVVMDGNIITSRGPGTAIDFSLTLLSILKGKAVSDDIKEKILYY